MRVLHWYPDFLEAGPSAVANTIRELAAAQRRRGADVAIAAATPFQRRTEPPAQGDSAITVIEWRPTYILRAFGQFFRGVSKVAGRKLRAYEPDVVHVHAGFNPDGLWAPRIFSCPIVLTPHGAFHPLVLQRGRASVKQGYLLLAKRLLYRRARAIHALCPVEREQIRDLLGGARVYCAPNGSSLRTLDTGIQREAWPPAGVRFVFVGRLDVFTKGLDILLEALACVGVRSNGQPASLILVGPGRGGSMEWLRQRSQALGLTERVTFAGALSSAEVARTLARSDVYVQLSRHDCFPLSLAEALVSGLPAIVSRGVGTTSYPEIASLPHVRIVPPSVHGAAAAMVDCARTLDRLRLLASSHQGWVRHFLSWDRIAQTHLDAYEGLLPAPRVDAGLDETVACEARGAAR